MSTPHQLYRVRGNADRGTAYQLAYEAINKTWYFLNVCLSGCKPRDVQSVNGADINRWSNILSAGHRSHMSFVCCHCYYIKL
jgi:hypothetical protein